MVEFSPVVPAQPDKAQYSPEALQLSPRLTRPIYQKMFGVQAPAYDPSRRIKRWFFTNILQGSQDQSSQMVQFNVWDASGKIITISMTAQEAATPNLPGTVVYEKYVNSAATVAQLQVINALGQVILAGQTGQNLVDPLLLEAVVDEAAKQLGLAMTCAEVQIPSPFTLVYGAETRRRMNVILPSGERIDGSAFARNRFEKGIWVPGKWSLNTASQPVFTPDIPVDGEQDARPEIPIPIRSLLPNEKIESRLDYAAGQLFYIARTDMAGSSVPTATGGGLTGEQAAQLTQIAKGVSAIQRFLGVEG